MDSFTKCFFHSCVCTSRIISDTMPTLKNCSAICRCCARRACKGHGTGTGSPEWTDAHPDAQIESVARYVFWLMDRDRKSTGLKSLQGKIWQQGYATGELKSQVFQDVLPALEYWKNKFLDVRIFFIGQQVGAKTSLANTEVGDLTHFLGGYF